MKIGSYFFITPGLGLITESQPEEDPMASFMGYLLLVVLLFAITEEKMNAGISRTFYICGNSYYKIVLVYFQRM